MTVTCEQNVTFLADMKFDKNGRMSFWFKDFEITDYIDGLDAVRKDAAELDDGDQIEVECAADCSATFHRGTEDYFDQGQENWFPGDPPSIEKLVVLVGKANVTKYISNYQIDSITERLCAVGQEEA